MLVKICGITHVDDARFALDAGADWIGLNLVAGPRRIDSAAAERILAGLDDPSRAVVLIRIGSDGRPQEPIKAFYQQGVRRLQLYGRKMPQAVQRVAQEGFESIMVQPVAEEASLTALDAMLASCAHQPPNYVLFDAATKGQLGGTGQCVNWDVLAQAKEEKRYTGWPGVLLAGGLNAANVGEAIRKTSPAGVDVSSGVEVQPGRKDHRKIEAFITAVRASVADRP